MPQTITKEMEEIRSMIALTVAKRDALKTQMKQWYETYPNKRFEDMNKLIAVDATLSKLDTHYKSLWDYYNKKEVS